MIAYVLIVQILTLLLSTANILIFFSVKDTFRLGISILLVGISSFGVVRITELVGRIMLGGEGCEPISNEWIAVNWSLLLIGMGLITISAMKRNGDGE